MPTICTKNLSISLGQWESKTTEGEGEFVKRLGGGTHTMTAWLMSTPFPPNVRYEGDARVWKYFGPYARDATIRVRLHYRVPLMSVGTGNCWNYFSHGWIAVPDADPDLDVPPVVSYVATLAGYGVAAQPSGQEWTVTEDLIVLAGTRVRYLVRMESQAVYVGGIGNPTAAFPVVECDEEIALKDPITGLYPAFVMPAEAAANNGMPTGNTPSAYHDFNAVTPGPFTDATITTVNVGGNGNSNVISVREELTVRAHISYEAQTALEPICDCTLVVVYPKDTVTGTGVFGSVARTATGWFKVALGDNSCYVPTGSCPNLSDYVNAEVPVTVTSYGLSTGGATIGATFTSASPVEIFPTENSWSNWEVEWEHWYADWY